MQDLSTFRNDKTRSIRVQFGAKASGHLNGRFCRDRMVFSCFPHLIIQFSWFDLAIPGVIQELAPEARESSRD